MIIYIYGSSGFRKDIHDVLEHSNIKFRLDEHGEIKELFTIEELKDAIEKYPNNIYLIDDAKIIKKNSLNQKIKFLKPKDGIEQEYLLDNGIGDISVDSIDELSKHIIKRLESVIQENNENDIEESIIDIVDEAYEQSDEDELVLDEELSSLLSHVEVEPEDESIADEVELVEVNEKDDIKDELSFLTDDEIALQAFTQEDSDEDEFCKSFNFKEDFGSFDLEEVEEETKDDKIDNELLSFGEEDFFNKDILEEIQVIQDEKIKDEEIENDTIVIDNIVQGENMADEFSEFDTLSEDDILAALDGLNNETSVQPARSSSPATVSLSTNNDESLNLSGSNVNDIAELISKLLNNKTLEITVKVKG